MATSFFGGSFFAGEYFTGGPQAVGGLKTRRIRRKYYVDDDSKIFLFDHEKEAFAFVEQEKKKVEVRSVKTGKRLKKPARVEAKPVDYDVINVDALKRYVEDQRIKADIERLIRLKNFLELLELQQMMEDEEDEILLMFA